MMDFIRISSSDIEFFKSAIGEPGVLFDAESIEKYSHDETENLHFPPEIVLKPSSTQEISSILRYCNLQSIAVTPRGAGTGLSGGALPVFGGVILSVEKMNHILFIDERNHQVTVEPGVITQVLQDAVKEKGL